MKIEDIEITGLTSDSRLVKPGFLFAALDSEKAPGIVLYSLRHCQRCRPYSRKSRICLRCRKCQIYCRRQSKQKIFRTGRRILRPAAGAYCRHYRNQRQDLDCRFCPPDSDGNGNKSRQHGHARIYQGQSGARAFAEHDAQCRNDRRRTGQAQKEKDMTMFVWRCPATASANTGLAASTPRLPVLPT